MHTTHARIYYVRYTSEAVLLSWRCTSISKKEDLYFPLYRRAVNKQTRSLLESHRESRPERKLSRLEGSTIATHRNSTGREVCH